MASSKCGRKTALSIFFAISLVAFLFSLVSLLSPSWQYANLENGRTEHHHGLWLDCKRDYSFDYGRTREYYETLYRRDMQGSPFEMFFLPPLQCVYKFDYYIDPEDLYDHNHDENRLQNDAYQHLFLGWKVAALAAIGVAVCFSATSSLLGICSFCHRTFICASTVLVTISAILSTVGLIVFYMWANYQDNKVIKEEEDTIYEQTLGWAFHFQVVGAILHWLSSILGCCVTSVSLGKNRGAKLVKIEVVEGDESMLLNSNSSIQPFKRSFSAIYRVDSQSLRQFEREYLRNAHSSGQSNEMSTFKRTASVPNFTKKQRKEDKQKQRQLNRSNLDLFTSNSNITESTRTGSVVTLDTQRTKEMMNSDIANFDVPTLPLPSKPLKSALKTPQSARKSYEDSTYEYLPCPGSMAVSSYSSNGKRGVVYDEVYEEIGPDTYLEPNSIRARSRASFISFDEKKKAITPPIQSTTFSSTATIPSITKSFKHSEVRNENGTTYQPKTTLIDDVIDSRSADSAQEPRFREQLIIEKTRTEEIQKTTKSRTQPSQSAPDIAIKPILKAMLPPSTKPPMTIRDFGVELNKEPKGYYTEISHKVFCQDSPAKSALGLNILSPYLKSKSDFMGTNTNELENTKPQTSCRSSFAEVPPSTSSSKTTSELPGICINTFANKEGQRSITNLTYAGKDKTAAEVFERPESVDLSSRILDKKKNPTIQRSLFRNLIDEVDRSVGSSTMLENDTMSETGSYIRDAEIRLNLFLNDPSKQQDETTV
ncbi:unnamed protein product [Auanema sp. JU1783]|nr:unnamed protein product [Auanema sp. JU1783]